MPYIPRILLVDPYQHAYTTGVRITYFLARGSFRYSFCAMRVYEKPLQKPEPINLYPLTEGELYIAERNINAWLRSLAGNPFVEHPLPRGFSLGTLTATDIPAMLMALEHKRLRWGIPEFVDDVVKGLKDHPDYIAHLARKL